jgi:5'-phosphate synthase pdxT subunit
MKIGVLALQGDFAEHLAMLRRIGVEAVEVRLAQHLGDLDGLVIPGGESTTIGKLAFDFELITPLQRFGAEKPIWGTCAGAIFLSKDVNPDAARAGTGKASAGSGAAGHRLRQPLLGLMDIRVARNAFGRQVDSFECDLDVPVFNLIGDDLSPYHAVFIRAPLIESVEADTRVLAQLPDGRIVAAQQGKLLATSFHPELTLDDRFHRYFLSLVG